MAAFTTTTGTFSALLPDPSGRPPKTNEEQRIVMTDVMARGYPGQATDSRWTFAERYTGAIYVAIDAVMKGFAGSSVRVLQRQPGARSTVYNAHDANASKDWAPVSSDHGLSRLFSTVNPQDTLIDYLSKRVMCDLLFGITYEYCPPDQAGKPCQLWSILPQYVTPAFGPNVNYPFGAWRFNLPMPFMYGFGNGGPAWVPIDARQVLVQKRPHPKWPWDGYSPLTAGANQLDTGLSIDQARKNSMDQGPSTSAVVCIPGATDQQLRKYEADFKQKYIGSTGAKVLFTSGDEVHTTATGITPTDMDYTNGYEQMTNFALALMGVPNPVANLTATSSFAQLYAAIQQFIELSLRPMANRVGAFWTKHLAHAHYGKELAIVVDVPQFRNPEMEAQRIQSWGTLGVLMVNEIRATENLEPVEGGDVPPSVYVQTANAKVQAQIQAEQQQAERQQQMAMQQGGISADTGELSAQNSDAQGVDGEQDVGFSADSDPEQAQAQDAISGGVLEALGVRGGDGAREQKSLPVIYRKAPDSTVNPFTVEFVRVSKAIPGWVAITTKTGKRAAQNTQTQEVVYGAEAEEKLNGQDDRHNPDLDAAFGAAPEAKKPVDESKMRDNAALDDVFGDGPTPKPGVDPKPKPLPLPSPGGILPEAAKQGVAPHAVKAAEAYLASLGTPPPTPAKGMTRLYRGEVEGKSPHENAFFADERGLAGVAIPFAKLQGRHLTYVDVPDAVAKQQELHGAVTDGEYQLPEQYRKQVRKWGESATPAGQTAGQTPNPAAGQNSQPAPAQGNAADQPVRQTVGQTAASAGQKTPSAGRANSQPLQPQRDTNPNSPNTPDDEPVELTPVAMPIAKRAVQQAKTVIPKLTPVTQTPAGQAALQSVKDWGRAAADRHGAAVAAQHGLNHAEGVALFLHVLSALARMIPVVGKAASAGIGVGAAVAGVHANRKRAERDRLGGMADQAKANHAAAQGHADAVFGGAAPSGAPRRPRNPAGAGSLGGRITRKSLAEYFDSLVEEV